MNSLAFAPDMYSKLPNLVLGFHGCDADTYNHVLHKHEQLLPKTQPYHWLGQGIYFWEQNLERAWKWSKAFRSKSPMVIGAVIDLGNCLNLLDSRSIEVVRDAYNLMEFETTLNGDPMPTNEGKMRYLDCAVIDRLCKSIPYDSARGVFIEDSPIYPNSNFYESSHIQICIRNPNCIKGYFSPTEIDSNWEVP